MTIRREGKRPPVISCDACGIVFASKLTDWRRFNYAANWKEAQAAGWTVTKQTGGTDWNHYCPDDSPYGGKILAATLKTR